MAVHVALVDQAPLKASNPVKEDAVQDHQDNDSYQRVLHSSLHGHHCRCTSSQSPCEYLVAIYLKLENLGTISISVPHSNFFWKFVSLTRVNYAHVFGHPTKHLRQNTLAVFSNMPL